MSTARSSGTDSPPRTSGPSPGSSLRSSRPVSRSTGRPSRARCAATASSSARSPEPVAATTVPSVRSPAGRPAASVSSAAKAGQRPHRLDAERQQLLLAGPGLGDGGEHAAGDPRGPGGGRGVEDRDAQTLLRGPPGTAQADDAGAQHQQLCVLLSHRAPCAGMTRIRFDGRDRLIPSQPPVGAPVRHLWSTLRQWASAGPSRGAGGLQHGGFAALRPQQSHHADLT